MHTKEVRDHATLRANIEALDLAPIKVKLMDKKEGTGWSREHADQMEILYKRFLFLMVTEKAPIVPTKEIDIFWHQHILDTRKYAEDCEVTFGYFLHHFPYFGMRGEEDAKNLASAFTETKQIFERVFGEPMLDFSMIKATDCSSCGPESCGGPGCVNSECSGDSAHSINDVMRVSIRPQLTTTTA